MCDKTLCETQCVTQVQYHTQRVTHSPALVSTDSQAGLTFYFRPKKVALNRKKYSQPTRISLVPFW